MRFWDASALVPLLVRQKASLRMRAQYRSDPVVAAWWGSRAECESAISRLERETKQFQEVGLKAYHHAIYYPLRPEFIPQAGKSADFLLWSTLLVDPENNPKHKEFGEKIKKRWNVVVNSDHASAYDGLYNILASIQRAGSLDPKKIVDALSNRDLKGIMGRYVFEQSNHQIKYGEEFVPVPACQIQEVKHRVIWPASLAAGTFQLPP